MTVTEKPPTSIEADGTDEFLRRARQAGLKVVPGSEFVSVLRPYNGAPTYQPAWVVQPRTPDEMAKISHIAHETGTPVSIVATGHHGGPSVTKGVTIATNLMQRIEIDTGRRTAYVDAGVTGERFLKASAAQGLTGVSGSAPTTSVLGVYLGGGLSPMSNAYGLGVDNVVAFHVAHLQTGRVLRVDGSEIPGVLSKAESERLLFALKGGGRAGFVVTGMEVKLHEGSKVLGGQIVYPQDQTDRVIEAYLTWAPTLPREATTSLAIMNIPAEAAAMLPEFAGQKKAVLRFASPNLDQSVLARMRFGFGPINDKVGVISSGDLHLVHEDPPQMPEGFPPLNAYSAGRVLRTSPAMAQGIVRTFGLQGQGVSTIFELRIFHPKGQVFDPSNARSAVTREGWSGVAHNHLLLPPLPPEVLEQMQLGPAAEHSADEALSGSTLPVGGPPTWRDHGPTHPPHIAREIAAAKSAHDPNGLVAAHGFSNGVYVEGPGIDLSTGLI